MSDDKLKAIELILKGNTIADVARIVGVNRKTIYNWLANDEFKAELDRQTTELKNGIDKKLLTNVEPILDKLIKIALNGNSEKTSLDACIYALNRLVGTPTTKVADVTEPTDNKINNDKDIDDLLNELQEDNIIIPKQRTKGA